MPQPGQQDLFADPPAADAASRASAEHARALPVPIQARPADPDDPAQALAEGLAEHAHRWALAQGAAADTAAHAARAARALSLATTDGHVCITLAQLAAEVADGPADWRASLLASGIVGTPAAPGARPLLLDGDGRLYLQRDFRLEQRLARRIATALAAPPQALPAGISPAAQDGALDAAAVAAAMALRHRLTIVSGGPGTGKTTAVVRLLGLLLAREPACRIALAAPTGKAAARMAEAIRQRAGDLPPAVRALLPSGASTLHRLLGVSPAARGGPGEGFLHHAGRPLPIDLLVIDEASMLDLALATRVFEAVAPAARIVLLGDQDQLAAVESGAVFAELSADPGLSEAALAELAAACTVPVDALRPPPPRHATGVRDAVVWFRRNHRFAPDSGIGRLAREVNGGDANTALVWLGAQPVEPGPGHAVHWLPDGAERAAAATEARVMAGYGTYLDTVRAHGLGQADAAEVLRSFDHYRVLCALRAGPRGVNALNERIGRWARAQLGPALDGDPRSPWHAGRPVMVLRNDPLLRLFNGDIGIALRAREGAGIELWFADPAGGVRAVAPLRLPEHTSAWAMTVHQSQGSEFQALSVLLPAQPQRVLSRELLYTAVTRAREQVTVVGSAAVIGAAIASPTQRQSGLARRLQEAQAEEAQRAASMTDQDAAPGS